MHKILRHFEIQTDHLISARRPDLVIVNKEMITCRLVDFAIQAERRSEIEKKKEKKDKYLDLVRELKKTVEHESDGDTNCN